MRDDSGVYEGYEVPIHYDPLISKLVAWGYSRRDAILRMRRAVSEYKILGIETTLPFFQRVLHHPAFVEGDFDTSFVERVFAASDRARVRPVEVAAVAAALQAPARTPDSPTATGRRERALSLAGCVPQGRSAMRPAA